jgi:hypothetical protein
MRINNMEFLRFRFLILALMLVVILSSQNYAIPSFSRQTNLACSACHYSYPTLNSFGRLFKLNGYTMVNSPTIEATNEDSSRTTLQLLSNLPISAMFLANVTSISKKIATGGDNTFIQAPSQMSIFIGGEITPHIGSFIQTTYSLTDGTFGLDLMDIRYANHAKIGTNDLIYGVTLNNKPTVQDVWNTMEAWGFPFVGTDAAPSAAIAAMNVPDGVVGLGAYAFYDNLVYAELSFYHASPAGVPYPPDSTWAPNLKGLAPYWRLALQHQWIGQYASIGTFGMVSDVFQSGITGLLTESINIGVDAQYEKNLDNGSSFIFHAAYETSKITLDPVNNNNLKSFKTDLTYNFAEFISLSAGYFTITGDNTNILVFDPNATGVPDSNGEILQLTFIPWLNTQFALQYTIFNKFNGSSNNYDGNGRNASDNNTLNLSAWLLL